MTVNATNHHVAAALFSDESAHDVTLSPHTQYHVSQEDVIRVESGKVFAVGPGQASIAAIFGDEISMVEVIVADNAFDTLALLPQGPTDVPVGQTIKYRLMASHHDHSEPTDVTTNTDVQWSVSGSGAADFSIDDGGVALKASLEGLVTLTASLDQITTDSSFSVVNAAPTALSLELATPEESWPVGRQPVFNVFVTYSDGEVHPVTGDDWRITW
ncbi:MAG: hypothetical protein GY814_16905, partial [Gammaproteobacteria bacterium]|nr:hypothetical protein [Gammaproteobacteria bacterium]